VREAWARQGAHRINDQVRAELLPLSFFRTFLLKHSSVSEPSVQIRYWYLPPWLAAT
jgi:hypothetical protein